MKMCIFQGGNSRSLANSTFRSNNFSILIFFIEVMEKKRPTTHANPMGIADTSNFIKTAKKLERWIVIF